jgi:phospho-N-acetylmuramoyl-pentapeptide-transferase
VFQIHLFPCGDGCAISLLITITFGERLINYLKKKQVGEEIRELGLEGQTAKRGTPTMGGLIIIAAILVPTFLLAQLDNVLCDCCSVTTVWMGLIGFLDDYIKVFKKEKEGLAGKI